MVIDKRFVSAMCYFLALLAFAVLASLSNADDTCRNIYIVVPPGNDGGVFYRTETSDLPNGGHSRQGYLSRGNLAKLIFQNNKKVEKFIRDKPKEDKTRHVKFVSADGSHGFIREEYIKPIKEAFPNRTNELNCSKEDLIAIPIHPLDPVSLVTINKTETLRQVHSFSRSNNDIVISSGESIELEYKKDEKMFQGEFYKAFFMQDQVDAFRRRDVLLPESEEGLTFQFLPINPELFKPVQVDTNSSLIELAKSFFKKILLEGNLDELARALGKSCRQEITFEGKVSVETPSILPAAVELGGQVKITFQKDRRYSLERYEGCESIKTIEIAKRILCKPDTDTDWYTDHLTVGGLPDNQVFQIFQDDLITRFPELFTKPDVTGFTGPKHEAMVGLKLAKVIGTPGQPKSEQRTDYFSAFARLGMYLEEKYLGQLDLNPADKARLKSLLIRLIIYADAPSR